MKNRVLTLWLLLTGHALYSQNNWEYLSKQPLTSGRGLMTSFCVNGSFYVGMGGDIFYNYYKDFWVYETNLDSWVKLKDFPGEARNGATACVSGKRVFVFGGSNHDSCFNELWEYYSSTDSWSKISILPSYPRTNALCFAFGRKLFVGTGYYTNDTMQTGNKKVLKDFWSFDIDSGKWKWITDYPAGPNYGGVDFVQDSFAYIGGGNVFDSTQMKFVISSKFYKLNLNSLIWSNISDYPDGYCFGSIGGMFNNKGVISNGLTSSGLSGKIWSYTPDLDNWTLLTENTSNKSYFGVLGIIGDTIFTGTGVNGTSLGSDFWIYSPTLVRKEFYQNLNISFFYPNPSKDRISICLQNIDCRKIDISIRDLYGKNIYVRKFYPNSIQETIDYDISEIPIGTYILLINGIAHKLIIQR